jgi:hypothetical protein
LTLEQVGEMLIPPSKSLKIGIDAREVLRGTWTIISADTDIRTSSPAFRALDDDDRQLPASSICSPLQNRYCKHNVFGQDVSGGISTLSRSNNDILLSAAMYGCSEETTYLLSRQNAAILFKYTTLHSCISFASGQRCKQAAHQSDCSQKVRP